MHHKASTDLNVTLLNPDGDQTAEHDFRVYLWAIDRSIYHIDPHKAPIFPIASCQDCGAVAGTIGNPS